MGTARLTGTPSLRRLAWMLSLLLLVPTLASAELLPVKTYTAADWLLRDSASCIVQDSRGFLWFCTADGLSRFDGYGFTNYTPDDGLPHRVVNDFLETRSGTYWVATNDGLARFNPKGQRGQSTSIGNRQPAIGDEALFVTYSPQDSRGGRSIEVLFEDAQGKLWCGTDDGLYWFEEHKGAGVFHRLDLPKAKMNSSSLVSAITEDQRGNLWVHAALTSALGQPDVRLQNCARWPLHQSCGQECLVQLDVAPEECLVRGVMMRWYQSKSCVYCGKPFEQVQLLDHKPALISPEGQLVTWRELVGKDLLTLLANLKPVSWDCYTAHSFVQEHPELVTYRPWREGIHRSQ